MQSDIEKAIEILHRGEVIALPTETVYGLAANAVDEVAVQKIFAIKSRPCYNPLIIHCASLEQISEFAELPKKAEEIFTAFSPGAITVILPQKENSLIAKNATANLPSIAVRIPSHPFARKLLQALPFALAAPSANISGKLSPTQAAHCENLGVTIFDGGACHYGLESTILDATGDTVCLLRQGSITVEEIERSLSCKLLISTEANELTKSPGQLLKHYSPHLPLVLNVQTPLAGDAYIAFGKTPHPFFRNLSPSADLAEAAHNLFSHLRDADASGASRIAVAPILGEKLAVTIRDRLTRAAYNSNE